RATTPSRQSRALPLGKGARLAPPTAAGYLCTEGHPSETRMHVEWTTYASPVGALTVVECEAGPLVVEFPHRAASVKWAVRLHSRQIGWLVAANHLAILIPCHRVVGKDGSLVGYGGGLAKKRWLLDHELRSAGVVLR